MAKRFFIILFTGIFLCSSSLATNIQKRTDIFGLYKKDITYTISSIKNHRNGLIIFGAILGSSLFADKEVRKYVNKHQNKTAKNVADFMNIFGKGYYMFPAVAFLSFSGYYAKDNKLFNASVTSLEAGMTSGLATVCLKTIIGRERPYSTNNPFKFQPLSLWQNRYHSFPSGDVAIAWSMITPYAVYYDEPILYLLPLSVDFARIYKNEHWLSDTVAASGIGFVTDYFMSKVHISRDITFLFNGRRIGIIYRFK